jgi:hypothetical protein
MDRATRFSRSTRLKAQADRLAAISPSITRAQQAAAIPDVIRRAGAGPHGGAIPRSPPCAELRRLERVFGRCRPKALTWRSQTEPDKRPSLSGDGGIFV